MSDKSTCDGLTGTTPLTHRWCHEHDRWTSACVILQLTSQLASAQAEVEELREWKRAALEALPVQYDDEFAKAIDGLVQTADKVWTALGERDEAQAEVEKLKSNLIKHHSDLGWRWTDCNVGCQDDTFESRQPAAPSPEGKTEGKVEG